MKSLPNYAVVTPVKDEERFIEQTLRSMVQQTCKPLLWVIVDDGSSDRTPEIIQRYADENAFIRLVRNPRKGSRKTGVAEVLAFNSGYDQLRHQDFDLIVKLDGDLSFEAGYFEGLLRHFAENLSLGIASGVYMEQRNGSAWQVVSMPAYHAAGASKVVRRKCFEEIGGFIAERGWDTVDEIRALARNWQTTHFDELRMKHLKPEGSGMGMLYTYIMLGEIYYRTGGGLIFFCAKILGRLVRPPYILGGLWMLWGYIRAAFSRRDLLVTGDEARCYRRLLNQRMLGRFTGNNTPANPPTTA